MLLVRAMRAAVVNYVCRRVVAAAAAAVVAAATAAVVAAVCDGAAAVLYSLPASGDMVWMLKQLHADGCF